MLCEFEKCNSCCGANCERCATEFLREHGVGRNGSTGMPVSDGQHEFEEGLLSLSNVHVSTRICPMAGNWVSRQRFHESTADKPRRTARAQFSPDPFIRSLIGASPHR